LTFNGKIGKGKPHWETFNILSVMEDEITFPFWWVANKAPIFVKFF